MGLGSEAHTALLLGLSSLGLRPVPDRWSEAPAAPAALTAPAVPTPSAPRLLQLACAPRRGRRVERGIGAGLGWAWVGWARARAGKGQCVGSVGVAVLGCGCGCRCRCSGVAVGVGVKGRSTPRRCTCVDRPHSPPQRPGSCSGAPWRGWPQKYSPPNSPGIGFGLGSGRVRVRVGAAELALRQPGTAFKLRLRPAESWASSGALCRGSAL